MRLRTVLATIFIVSLFIISATIQPWSDPGSISLNVHREQAGTDGSVMVNYTLSPSPYSDPIKIVLIPVDIYITDPIYIFAEKEKYSTREYASVLGLYDHLRAEVDNLGMKRTVKLITQPEVAKLLNGGPSVLIIVNSTQDWAEQSPAMISWIEKGGQIFGIGKGALPFISADSGNDRPNHSAEYFIGYEPLDYNGGLDVSPSATADALNLKYISPRFGMKVDDVESYGLSVGFIYTRGNELTSAALIQRGNGSIILFSDVMVQPFTTSMEDVVAADIAGILASGLPREVGTLFSFQTTGGTNPTVGGFLVKMTSSKILVCFAFSTADHQHRSLILVV